MRAPSSAPIPRNEAITCACTAFLLLAALGTAVDVLPACLKGRCTAAGACQQTVKFTSLVGNASITRFGLDPLEGEPLQQCSLYEKLSVCLEGHQSLSIRIKPDSFNASAGAKCSLQDVRVLRNREDNHVVFSQKLVESCFLSRRGCDCARMNIELEDFSNLQWDVFQLTPLSGPTEGGRKPHPFSSRTNCNKKNKKDAYIVFALACPLQSDEWVSVDVEFHRTTERDTCNPQRLRGQARLVYACFIVLGVLMVIGFTLVLMEQAAERLVHYSHLNGMPVLYHWAMRMKDALGGLFDIHGVLHMDMVQGRDRFFTVNVMTSVVLMIAIIIFAPVLKHDEAVAFGEPHAQWSDLSLKPLVAITSEKKIVRSFLNSLLTPLLTLAVSACFGLLAYLILLVNYTSPPPWTRAAGAPLRRIKKSYTRMHSHRTRRVKYLAKKLVSLMALAVLDVVSIMMITQLFSSIDRLRYIYPFLWLQSMSLLFSLAMHLKFVEVVILELHDGGILSSWFCCCLCFRSIKMRYSPLERAGAIMNPRYLPYAEPVRRDKLPGKKLGGKQTEETQVTDSEVVHTISLDQGKTKSEKLSDQKKIKYKALEEEEGDDFNKPVRAHSITPPSPPLRERFKMLWSDVRGPKNFQYTGWFLAATTISAVLAVFFYAMNLNKVFEITNCMGLAETCTYTNQGSLVPTIMTGISAVLSQGNLEASLVMFANTYLGAKLDTFLVGVSTDAIAAGEAYLGESPVTLLNTAVQTCDDGLFDATVNSMATGFAQVLLAANDSTLLRAVHTFNFDVPGLVKPVLDKQIRPMFDAACTQLNQGVNVTTTRMSETNRVVEQTVNFLAGLQESFLVGSSIGCSIGLVISLVSLVVIMRVYRDALLRLHKEKALKSIVHRSKSDTKNTLQMFLLTEEARETFPLRAVFFYGVIFSSVLLQMQITSAVISGALMMFMIRQFWTVVMVQVAAYMVTALVGLLISILVVGTLGHQLAPNGRITSPSGWLVYYIIFSCAYIVMGVFIAVSRLVFVIVTSLLYIVRIDKCINLIGKQLDPAYTSFLGMIRMHTELRASAARNKRYTGSWGRVRRVVFERKQLLKQELERRKAAQEFMEDL